MPMQPDSLRISDEGRHNLALFRLYQAAIRKGEEIEELEAIEQEKARCGAVEGEQRAAEKEVMNGHPSHTG
jgi:hypothetical protein